MNRLRALLAVLLLAFLPGAATAETSEALSLPAGTRLHLLANPAAPVVATLEADSEAEVLDRHGDWLRVRAGEVTGWWNGDLSVPEPSAPAPGTSTSTSESGGIDAASIRLGATHRTGAGPEDWATRNRALADASAHMGPAARTLRVGPFALRTDVDDEALLASLEVLAGHLSDAYAQRYGLPAPTRSPDSADSTSDALLVTPASEAGTLILFAQPESYRAFSGDDRHAGHTAGRVAALALDDDPRRTRRVFAHEVGHLLNRWAFAAEPPIWLDEGLAGDLELFPSREDGTLSLAALGRRAARLAGGGRPYGPLVPLDRLILAGHVGRLETLAILAAVDRPTLLDSPRRADLYALSALWVRFLLDDGGAGEAQSAVFRGHLQEFATATTPPPLPESLASPALDRTFRNWLESTAKRIRKTPKTP